MRFTCPIDNEHTIDIESIEEKDSSIIITWTCQNCSAAGTYVTDMNEAFQVYCMRKEDFDEVCNYDIDKMADDLIRQMEKILNLEDKIDNLEDSNEWLESMVKEAGTIMSAMYSLLDDHGKLAINNRLHPFWERTEDLHD